MLNHFAKVLNKTMNKQKVLTENGAVAYKTAGRALVDFNFKMSSYRNLDEKHIVNDFINVFNEDKMLAVKMLFFAGDIRQGMGERKVFNACMNWLADFHPEIAIAVMPLIAEYNRWDSAVNFCFNNNVSKEAIRFISNKLAEDMDNMNQNKSISLLAKWMPSINTSSAEVVKKGNKMAKFLGKNKKDYRKMLSQLRKYLEVVEVKMSTNNWSEINYNAVPSKANIIYKEAFMKHDKERRMNYLRDLETGEAKINSSVAFPYDIIHKYEYLHVEDPVLEAMWKALPDYVGENGNDTICVVDGSGSMTCEVGKSSVTAFDVASSLAIYFSEKMSGAFNNKFITFSDNPQLVTLDSKWSLLQKFIEVRRHDEVASTNIEKVFKLILETAKQGNLTQEELPKNILILSDMEFNAYSVSGVVDYHCNDFDAGLKTLFENLIDEYNAAGYKMPRLVFWNICSRTNAIPLQNNEAGVALVSGFSPAIASMVFSNKLDPYIVLVDKLNSARYDAVENAIKEFI